MKARPQVAFRVDASVEMGTGHAMRCLTLADELRRRGVSTRFLSRRLPNEMRALLRSRGHELVMLPGTPLAESGRSQWLEVRQEEDAQATIAALAGVQKCTWLVVDHYGLDATWESAVRVASRRVLVIDDLADRRHDADALVDANAALPERYAGLLPVGCRSLLGPAFALLRPEFQSPPHSRVGRGTSLRVSVCFGGTDPDGMTIRALEAIRILGRADVEVDVVVGTGNPRRDEVAGLCRCLPGTSLHVGPSNMAELFGRATLGLGAGGVTAWERCRTGLPSVVISIADNQRTGCRTLARARAALDLGGMAQVSAASLARILGKLAGRPRLLDRMSRRASALVDGRGVERIATFMLRGPLSLRRAGGEDARHAWEWRNHPATRRYSLDSSELPWSTHVGWWEAAIASPRRALLVVEAPGSVPVGILRYDLEGEVATISVYLDPGLGGLGLGSAVLRAGTEWVRQHLPAIRRIHAVILPENLPSIRSFRAAGYQPLPSGRDWTLTVEGTVGSKS